MTAALGADAVSEGVVSRSAGGADAGRTSTGARASRVESREEGGRGGVVFGSTFFVALAADAFGASGSLVGIASTAGDTGEGAGASDAGEAASACEGSTEVFEVTL